MGWNNGTELFDAVMDAVIQEHTELTPKIETIVRIIEAFENADWDTQNESRYFDHPQVNEAFRLLHPDWFEDDDGGQ